DRPVDLEPPLTVRPPAQGEPCETPQDAARQEHEREQPVDPHGNTLPSCFRGRRIPPVVLLVPRLVLRQTARTAKPNPPARKAFPARRAQDGRCEGARPGRARV